LNLCLEYQILLSPPIMAFRTRNHYVVYNDAFNAGKFFNICDSHSKIPSGTGFNFWNYEQLLPLILYLTGHTYVLPAQQIEETLIYDYFISAGLHWQKYCDIVMFIHSWIKSKLLDNRYKSLISVHNHWKAFHLSCIWWEKSSFLVINLIT
jgi:hypothetical protein